LDQQELMEDLEPQVHKAHKAQMVSQEQQAKLDK
jgi:hypothetical protein